MLKHLRLAVVALALVVASLLVLSAGVTLIAAQADGGNGCGPPPAAACQTGGMP